MLDVSPVIVICMVLGQKSQRLAGEKGGRNERLQVERTVIIYVD